MASNYNLIYNPDDERLNKYPPFFKKIHETNFVLNNVRQNMKDLPSSIQLFNKRNNNKFLHKKASKLFHSDNLNFKVKIVNFI